MTLGDKQRLFTYLFAKLTLWAYRKQYKLTDGDAYRDPRLHGRYGEKVGYGSAHSNHKYRLARDVNLFKIQQGRWTYQQSTDAYRKLGRKWKSMHPLCRWGGDFSSSDGNHFSMEHNGRA